MHFHYKNVCKTVWKVIKKYTAFDCKNKYIDKLIVNNTDITDFQQISDHFNNHFTSSVRNNCLPNRTRLDNIQIEGEESSIFLNPLNINEFLKIVKSLNNSMAVGCDNVRTHINNKNK